MPAAENFGMQQDPRRASPRVGLEALCWELVHERERSSLVVDLSETGARLERPYLPASYIDYDHLELGPAGKSRHIVAPVMPRPRDLDRIVPLQLEIPEIDEVMWARGDVVFDELVPVKHNGGPFGLLRRTGFHLALAARDTRLIRDYVYDVVSRRHAAANDDDAVDWMRCFG